MTPKGMVRINVELPKVLYEEIENVQEVEGYPSWIHALRTIVSLGIYVYLMFKETGKLNINGKDVHVII